MIRTAWLMGKVMRYIALERRATIGASAELALPDRYARALLRLHYGPQTRFLTVQRPQRRAAMMPKRSA
jgi:hypothetical protein